MGKWPTVGCIFLCHFGFVALPVSLHLPPLLAACRTRGLRCKLLVSHLSALCRPNSFYLACTQLPASFGTTHRPSQEATRLPEGKVKKEAGG